MVLDACKVGKVRLWMGGDPHGALARPAGSAPFDGVEAPHGERQAGRGEEAVGHSSRCTI